MPVMSALGAWPRARSVSTLAAYVVSPGALVVSPGAPPGSYTSASAFATTSGAHTERTRTRPRSPAARSPARCAISAASQRAGLDRHLDALLGRQARDHERVRRAGLVLSGLVLSGLVPVAPIAIQRAHRWRDHVHALPGQRRAKRAQTFAGEGARHDQ